MDRGGPRRVPAARGDLERNYAGTGDDGYARGHEGLRGVQHPCMLGGGRWLAFLCPGLGMLVIANQRNAQGFYVEYFGDTPRRPLSRSGLQVILESWADEESGCHADA